MLQSGLPDYRLPFFEMLRQRIPGMKLLCGQSFFTADLKLCTEPAAWRRFLNNRFLLGRALLWQAGIGREAITAEVVIAEFNPRILSTWAILLRRRLAGRRTILWGHLWGQHGPQWLARYIRMVMIQLADGMICYTRSQQEELLRLSPGYSAWSAGNSCVIREICRAASSPLSGGCVSYVGRLIKDKKPGLLLEAFSLALSRLPSDARLLLVGNGEERERLKTRVIELGLSDRVEMPGHISDVGELQRIYDCSLVAVSPGYVGLSAIQAMSFGVPMLVSRDEPHSPEIEACVEGETAVFFRTDDATDLAGKLVGFFQKTSPWKERREIISRFIADNYTFDGMVEAFASAARLGQGQATGLGGGKKVALVWAQYGPYHRSRLEAFQQAAGAGNVVGIELGSRTSTYAWRRKTKADDDLITLMPGCAAEDVRVSGIYSAALRSFRQHNVDVVFIPSYWPASSIAVLMAARNANARVVMMNESHAHTVKARGIWAQLKRRLVRQFDAALVGGTPHREYFASMGMIPDRIVVGYDAVDNDFFAARSATVRREENRERFRSKHGLPARYFLNVGRMVWKKNLETLIDAYKQVKDRVGEDCPRLVLVGSGKLERSLCERCLRHDLSIWQAGADANQARKGDADVFFYGFRQVEELPEFYALAECFVLPSREEEWGLVVNEAMACGLPVLLSRVAGCARDLARDGENGFLFDPFDVAVLSARLETMARQPELSARMGRVSEQIIAEWGCARFAKGAMEATRLARL